MAPSHRGIDNDDFRAADPITGGKVRPANTLIPSVEK
jgi:hypothetical protein